MRSIFCTLCEGDYHLGAAALLNSLIYSGFKGCYVVGWRGSPPPWFESLLTDSSGHRTVCGVRVVLEEVTTSWLLAHIKPHFMLDVVDRIAPDADSIFYADPDIVIDAPWSFYEAWVQRGVALCEDNCFANLSRDHYLRQCWREFARSTFRVDADSAVDRGYNSGFVGARLEDRKFLTTWKAGLENLAEHGIPLERLKPGSRLDAFFGTDQDMLNVTTMIHPHIISTLGPEGMGFASGMTVMWHAVDSPKPWRRSYLWTLLRSGTSVSQAHRLFWKHTKGPVRPVGPVKRFIKQVDLWLAVFISRFYHSA